MSEIFIPSETGPLKKIIIHSPDPGIASVTPDRAVELLYEDIVYFPEMVREHLKRLVGLQGNVIEVSDLLKEILEKDGVRDLLTKRVISHEADDESILSQLNKLGARELALAFISGIDPRSGNFLFAPIPNFIFTRDIGSVVNDHIQ